MQVQPAGACDRSALGRPLPNRTNVVITRQQAEIAGCTVAHSLGEALALFPGDDEVFVIGGAQIYAQALPLADRFYLTRVFRAYEGDTHFPEWDEAQWRLGAYARADTAVHARVKALLHPYVLHQHIEIFSHNLTFHRARNRPGCNKKTFAVQR